MNKINPDKISVIFLPDLRASVGNFASPALNGEFRKIIREQITPDRAVIARVPSISGEYAAKYCKKIGKPILVEVVGCPWDSLWNHSLKGKLIAPFEFFNQRQAVKNAPYVLYVTGNFLQKRYPTNGVNIGVSDVELSPTDSSVLESRLDRISSHSGAVKLGTAAAIDISYKGQQYVVNALAGLKNAGRTDFEYHLAGGGDKTALYDLAKKLGVDNRVIFDGSLPHDKMFSWLDGLDIYIQPSLQDGLPRSVVEAMSRGLPCIGAETGGIPELLGYENIFPRKNGHAIADMLSSFDTSHLSDMAKANFKKAKAFEHTVLETKRDKFLSQFKTANQE